MLLGFSMIFHLFKSSEWLIISITTLRDYRNRHGITQVSGGITMDASCHRQREGAEKGQPERFPHSIDQIRSTRPNKEYQAECEEIGKAWLDGLTPMRRSFAC